MKIYNLWSALLHRVTINTQNAKAKQMHTKTKHKSKPTLSFKNCSCVRIIVYDRRTQHSTEQF